MPQISASLLSADLADLAAQARRVLQAGADMLHIDIMDGHFVPNISFGPPVLASLHRALPDAFYDVHLMITDPLRYLEPTVQAGAGLITFHVEALPDAAAVEKLIAAIHAAGRKAGLSLRPGTPVEAVLPYLPQLDLVLVMSVEPGFGGQSFRPAALQKLTALRAACAGLPGGGPVLQVDGGVNAATGLQCVRAGAGNLVVGSALFKAADPAALITALHRVPAAP